VSADDSVRERRRADTVQEIKTAALEQLAEPGAGALSLRGVARAIGMTVQSIYHYFDSRDALLTALVIDAHHALADAVEAANDATRGRPPFERRMAATRAYREWALDNRAAFRLLYCTTVPGFERGTEATGPASLRLAAAFMDVTFDGWSPEELDAVPLQPEVEPVAKSQYPYVPLPPGALEYFVELRARMHGLVMLELLGHLHPFNDVGEAVFAGAMRRQSAEIDALHAAVTS
jgi:AcrR family transcriptional regulator